MKKQKFFPIRLLFIVQITAFSQADHIIWLCLFRALFWRLLGSVSCINQVTLGPVMKISCALVSLSAKGDSVSTHLRVCVCMSMYAHVCAHTCTQKWVCITHGKCFAQCLPCSRHSVNISYFYSGEKEGVLRPVGKGQEASGSRRWIQLFAFCVALWTPARKGSWPLWLS